MNGAALRSLGGVARSLILYRARPWRQAALVRLYRGLLPPGALAFDVGAHVGNRSAALRRAGARVVALEPQPAFFRLLQRSMPEGVLVLPLAAGAAPGRARMAVSRLHPTVSSIAPGFAERIGLAPGFEHVAWDAEVEVEVTTLDALIAAHGRPDFVKIDVEGFEAEVLAGLSEPVPLVAFEYLPAALGPALACIDRLETLGHYRFGRIEGEQVGLRGAWHDADGMRRMLTALGAEAGSGDVYARLEANRR